MSRRRRKKSVPVRMDSELKKELEKIIAKREATGKNNRGELNMARMTKALKNLMDKEPGIKKTLLNAEIKDKNTELR